MLTIAGTGHRPPKLGGFGDNVYVALTTLAGSYLAKHRPDSVISGMALGWDQALAQAAMLAGISFTAVLPFTGQELRWPDTAQTRFHDMLDSAADIVIVSPGGYGGWKMQKRNEWMVDHSNRLVALYEGGSRGGTANCLRYAGFKPNYAIDNLWDDWTAMQVRP